MFHTLSSKILALLLLVVGLLPAQQTIGGGRSRVGGASATGDVLCRSSTGIAEACATADFFWNSGLFIDLGGLTCDQDGNFGAGTCIIFGDGDTQIFESADDSLTIRFVTFDIWTWNIVSLSSVNNGSVALAAATSTAALPAYQFVSDPDTGMYWIGANNYAFSVGGVKFFELGGSQTALFQDTTTTTGATRVLISQGDADSDTTVLATIAGGITAKPSGTVPACEKYTKTAADLTTSSGTEDEVLFNLPARGKLTSVNIKHTLAFSGGSLSAMTVSVGDSSSTTFYTSALDIFQAVSNTTFLDADMFLSSTFAARDVLARFTATSETMDNVDAGSVDIHVCWVVLP